MTSPERCQRACSWPRHCKSNLFAIVDCNALRLWRHCTKWMWLVAEKKEFAGRPACLPLSELSPLLWRNCANCIKRVWILLIMPHSGRHKSCWSRRIRSVHCFCYFFFCLGGMGWGVGWVGGGGGGGGGARVWLCGYFFFWLLSL